MVMLLKMGYGAKIVKMRNRGPPLSKTVDD